MIYIYNYIQHIYVSIAHGTAAGTFFHFLLSRKKHWCVDLLCDPIKVYTFIFTWKCGATYFQAPSLLRGTRHYYYSVQQQYLLSVLVFISRPILRRSLVLYCCCDTTTAAVYWRCRLERWYQTWKRPHPPTRMILTPSLLRTPSAAAYANRGTIISITRRAIVKTTLLPPPCAFSKSIPEITENKKNKKMRSEVRANKDCRCLKLILFHHFFLRGTSFDIVSAFASLLYSNSYTYIWQQSWQKNLFEDTMTKQLYTTRNCK